MERNCDMVAPMTKMLADLFPSPRDTLDERIARAVEFAFCRAGSASRKWIHQRYGGDRCPHCPAARALLGDKALSQIIEQLEGLR